MKVIKIPENEKVRIVVKLGRTINIGDYNSVRIDVGCEKDVDPGAESEEMDQLEQYLKSKLRKYGGGYSNG